MNESSNDTERDNIAFRRLKPEIDATHPPGWFVAIANGQVIAAAADFHALERTLRAQGRDPRRVFVIEAGANYPEYVTIFI